MDPDDLKALFAERVSSVAKMKGLSVNRLADFAGVSRGHLSDVLRCKKSASLRTVALLANALDLPPHELIAPAPKS